MAYNQGLYTDYHKPLEQMKMLHEDTQSYWEPNNRGKLGDATNVWAIGVSLIYLMNREDLHNPVETAPTFVLKEAKDMEPLFNDNAKAVYSEELRGLLSRCTRYWHADRIGLRELHTEIARHTGKDSEVEVRALGMR